MKDQLTVVIWDVVPKLDIICKHAFALIEEAVPAIVFRSHLEGGTLPAVISARLQITLPGAAVKTHNFQPIEFHADVGLGL